MPDMDINDLILDEHERFRREFVALWNLRPHADTAELTRAWEPLADLLEVHASAEEEMYYPVLLKRGSDDAEDETDDAIRDHNDIRDGVRAASRENVGTDAWWDAVLECRKANDEHMSEEERDVLPDFHEHTSPEVRADLGRRWEQYHRDHRGARGVDTSDKDPDEYIEAHSPD